MGNVRPGSHGLVMYGLVMYGLVQYGLVMYGLVQYGQVVHGPVQYGQVVPRAQVPPRQRSTWHLEPYWTLLEHPLACQHCARYEWRLGGSCPGT